MADNQQPSQKPGDNGKSGLSWSQPQQNSSAAKPAAKPAATPAKSESGTGRVIGIIIGIVVIFALAAWGIVALRHRSQVASTTATSTAAASTATGTETTTGSEYTQTGTDTSAQTTTPAVSGNNASFSVASQPAGDSVAVTGLSLSQPTWVVVYESRNGKPGNILGAGLFFPGDVNVSVPLLRGTVSGQTYFVTEAADNGNRSFSVADEKPVTDQSGAQVWTTFTAQ